MKFRSDEDGFITALRFYKQPNNTGTHVGHLWTEHRTAAGRGQVHERDRLRLAGGGAADSRSRSAATRSTSPPTTRLRVASASAGGYFLGGKSKRRSRPRRHGRRGGNGVYQLRARASFPDQTLERDQLLGRRDVRVGSAPIDTRAAARELHLARPPARPASPSTRRHGDLRRGGRPADREQRVVHAQRRHRRHRCRRPSPTTPRTRQGDAQARSRRSASARRTRRRSRAARRRRRPRRQPARRRHVVDVQHRRGRAPARPSRPSDAPGGRRRARLSRSRSA